MVSSLLYLLVLGSIFIISSSHQAAQSPRIVGGQTAKPGQFPYMVSLRFPTSPGAIDHFCGGAIINKNWIATAAHCVDAMEENNNHTGQNNLPQIAVGSINRLEGVVYNSSRMIKHPEYNRTSLINDIALIQTAINMTLNDYVQPIEVWDVDVNVTCVVSGWGQYEEEEHYADQLQFLNVTTISIEECRERWHQTNYSYIGDKSVCVNSAEGTGFCIGDSGGPLACDGTLAGLVSFNVPCAETPNRDVYTRVDKFVDWMYDVIFHS